METIYCYAEHTTRKGTIYGDSTEGASQSDDCFLWGEGTHEELIAQALERLAKRTDTRTAGAGDSFDWKCARAVLAYLDGPEVEYDAERRAFFPVADAE